MEDVPSCAPDQNCVISECHETTTSETISWAYECYDVVLGARVYDPDKSFMTNPGATTQILVTMGNDYEWPTANCLEDTFPEWFLDWAIEYCYVGCDIPMCSGSAIIISDCEAYAEAVCDEHHQGYNLAVHSTAGGCCTGECNQTEGGNPVIGYEWCC